MNKIYYAIIGLFALTSCANTFNITGTTSVSTLDGQKLYLKVLKDTTMKNLDSCDVVHGNSSSTALSIRFELEILYSTIMAACP